MSDAAPRIGFVMMNQPTTAASIPTTSSPKKPFHPADQADMKEGETRYIILPPKLAYGSMSVAKIPPNSTLRFRVELLKVK